MSTKLQNITTPKGSAMWANVTIPNTKFNPDGDFDIKVVVPAKEASEFQSKLDDLYDQAYQSALKEAGGKKVKQIYEPYEIDEETGDLTVKFKNSATYKSKADGSIIKRKIAIFDAKGKPITSKSLKIGNGSTVKVSGFVSPYYKAALGSGISLKLQALQVIDLVEGGASAGTYGFDAEEGFSYDVEDFEEQEEETEAEVADTDIDEEDF